MFFKVYSALARSQIVFRLEDTSLPLRTKREDAPVVPRD